MVLLSTLTQTEARPLSLTGCATTAIHLPQGHEGAGLCTNAVAITCKKATGIHKRSGLRDGALLRVWGLGYLHLWLAQLLDDESLKLLRLRAMRYSS